MGPCFSCASRADVDGGTALPQAEPGVAPEAPETDARAPSLVDVLGQLELPTVEALIDQLVRYCSIANLRLTCRALRDLADASIRLASSLMIQLREDGTVTEPLAALERWGRRGGLRLMLQLPAEAPGGVGALLPAAFADLPEAVRRRVCDVHVHRSNCLAPSPVVSSTAVPALASLLPGLRSLGLSELPSTWSPGGAGEAFTALAALGTLEELRLPGVPGVTGVEALAGSLRSLSIWEREDPRHTLTLSAVAPLIQLTRLQELRLCVADADLGEGSLVQALLRLLPPSLRLLTLHHAARTGLPSHRIDATFGVSSGRLVSAGLDYVRIEALAVLARQELLPCLGSGGRLASLSIGWVLVDGWGDTDVAPVLELWRRSDRARVKSLGVERRRSAADVCSALAALGPVEELRIVCRWLGIHIALPPQPPPPPPASASAPLADLPPPEEVLRTALQRIVLPGPGGAEGGAAAGGTPGTAADEDEKLRLFFAAFEEKHCSQGLILRGPAAAAALAQLSTDLVAAWDQNVVCVKAWAQDLERRARAAAADAVGGGRPLIKSVIFLPPASAVLLSCIKAKGAAEAVVAAVEAAWDGSEVQRATVPNVSTCRDASLGWGLGKVMSELWAASCAGAGGPNLQQRVEWALAVKDLVDGQSVWVPF